MLEAIKTDLTHRINSSDVHVIVLSAKGPVFSSGHDLKELVRNLRKMSTVQLTYKVKWI